MPIAGLYVAIYNDGGVFKHWSLFVDGPSAEEKVIFHIMGSSQRYRHESRQSNARQSASLLEMVPLCRIETSKLSDIEAAAQNTVIHNEAPGYNCQDYVLELLDTMEEEGIIDGSDKKYRKNKNAVRGKQEGFT